MNFDEYYDAVKDVPDTDSLKYDLAIMWLNRALLPLKVVSVGNASGVIKIPSRVIKLSVAKAITYAYLRR